MSNLQTTYLGLNLKNPIIAGASKLTANINTIKQIEAAGASAIVCNSLFEEQVQLEQIKLENAMTDLSDVSPEMISIFPQIEHGGPKEHLYWVEKTKKEVSIPVIGSLNCVNKATWLEYAKSMEQTGVDALELNFFHTPQSFDITSADVEKQQIEIVAEVKQAVKIPISVKLSYFYSSPLNLIREMDNVGVAGFVLFNRMFQPDIDIETQEHITPFKLSNEKDSGIGLRFAGLLYNQIKADICSNTGIFTGMDLVKTTLAGANAVQVVSTLYANQISYIKTMLTDLTDWMTEKNYESLDDFRGLLSKENTNDPFVYRRGQYVSLIMKSEEILKIYRIDD